MNTKQQGLTLLELLIGLILISLLISTGVPGLSRLIHSHRAESAYQELFSLVQFARIHSVTYHTQVILCPSSNQNHCDGNWNNDLMIFVDLNHDEQRNDDEVILRVLENDDDEHSHLSWQASGSTRYLRYKEDGTTANQNGRLTFCLTQGEQVYARQIIMYRTGRARRASEEEAKEKC